MSRSSKLYNNEEVKLKEWESKFDQEMKLNEEKELMKIERLALKEKQKQGLLDQEHQQLEEELTSRLESFEIKQTKKN